MKTEAPKLRILINFWSLLHEADPTTDEGLRKQLSLIQKAGFDAYFSFPNLPNLKKNLQDFGLRFAGRIDSNNASEFEEKIRANLAIDSGDQSTANSQTTIPQQMPPSH